MVTKKKLKSGDDDEWAAILTALVTACAALFAAGKRLKGKWDGRKGS